MKTVAHFLEVPENDFWVVFDGDKREFNDVFINSGHTLADALSEICYDEYGDFLLKKITREEAESFVQSGAYLISCGFML